MLVRRHFPRDLQILNKLESVEIPGSYVVDYFKIRANVKTVLFLQ